MHTHTILKRGTTDYNYKITKQNYSNLNRKNKRLFSGPTRPKMLLLLQFDLVNSLKPAPNHFDSIQSGISAISKW